MEQQHLREILGKPENPEPMTLKSFIELLAVSIKVLVRMVH